MGWEVGGELWGLAAFVVAVIGAVGQLAQRRLSAQPLVTRTEP